MLLHYSNPVIQETSEMKRKISQQSNKSRRTSRRIRNKRVITPPLTASSPAVKRKGLSKNQCLSLINIQLSMVIEKFHIHENSSKPRLDMKLIQAHEQHSDLFRIHGIFPDNKELVCNSASFAVALDMIGRALDFGTKNNTILSINIPLSNDTDDIINLPFVKELKQVLHCNQRIFVRTFENSPFNGNNEASTEDDFEKMYQNLKESRKKSPGDSKDTEFQLSEDERRYLYHLCCRRQTLADFIRACNNSHTNRPKSLLFFS